MLHNGKGMGHNLWDIMKRELQVEPGVKDLGGSDWGRPVLTEDQLDYAADDVVWLPRLRQSLRAKLAAAGLNRVALIEFGAIAALLALGQPIRCLCFVDLRLRGVIQQTYAVIQCFGFCAGAGVGQLGADRLDKIAHLER